MILTDEERVKFANYLRESADIDSKLAEQLSNLGGSPAIDKLAQKYKTEAMAAKIISQKLSNTSVEVLPEAKA